MKELVTRECACPGCDKKFGSYVGVGRQPKRPAWYRYPIRLQAWKTCCRECSRKYCKLKRGKD